MEQYHELLKTILGRGDVMFEPRTQEYIIGISAHQSVYDLRRGFPLPTTKLVEPRFPFEELFWKLRGERTAKSLSDRGIHFWEGNAFDRYLKVNKLTNDFPKHSPQWAEKYDWYKKQLSENPESVGNGDLGPVYGYQWRHWKKFVKSEEEWLSGEPFRMEEVDQLKNLLRGIKQKPGSRYHILNAWNPADLEDMALGPCPFWHQFSVFGKNIDLTMVQRSCDSYLGVPFNIAQDALLLEMVAKETGFNPRFFNHSYVNVHAYLGVPPRSDFWLNENNVRIFQDRFNFAVDSEEYLELRDWYLKNAPEESPGNEKKDHVPFILEQISKKPQRNLSEISFKADAPLLEAIKMNAMDVVEVHDYNPQRWKSRAWMAV